MPSTCNDEHRGAVGGAGADDGAVGGDVRYEAVTGGAACEAVAELTDVTLAYEHGTVALDRVSLRVRAGERLCVLGANGSGKSTLASVLCGLLAPDAGSVTLVGQDACVDSTVDLAAYRLARRRLGLVFQNPQDQMVTTVVEEDVAFGPENLGLPADEIGRRVERELARVAMSDYAKSDPSRLSGGQCQRVAIAGALAMEPSLLVLDEPGALLDVRGRRGIMRVMGRLRDAGTAIVHVTHFMEEALAADRVIVMDHGRIALDGTPDEVFSHTDALRELGLEEPFCARLAGRLRDRGVDVAWTCREDALVAELAGVCLVGDYVHADGTSVEAADVTAGAQSADGAGVPTGADDAGVAAMTDGASGGDSAPADVDCEHVRYSYHSRRSGVTALDDVTLSVPAGAFCSIVGQTGSGKSTLLRLLAALEAPDAGNVRVAGIDTARRRDRRRLHGRVGLVMQRPERQFFAESVLADVSYGPSNLGLPADEVRRRALGALDVVGLSGREDASPFELSGGQRRLCAIAGILAMHPRVLLLDEPMAGLDPRGRDKLRAVLGRVREAGVTVVQVTHSMDEAARSDLVFVLDRSRVALAGPSSRVFSTDNAEVLRACGLGLPRAMEFARGLEVAGLPSLGAPLSLAALSDAVVAAVGSARGEGSTGRVAREGQTGSAGSEGSADQTADDRGEAML